jgi:hypothetical protein
MVISLIIRVKLVGFEADTGVILLHNGDLVKIPRGLLPYDARPGDIIKIRVDKGATLKAL